MPEGELTSFTVYGAYLLFSESGIVIDLKSRSCREYLIPTDKIMVLDSYFNLTKKSNLIGGL